MRPSPAVVPEEATPVETPYTCDLPAPTSEERAELLDFICKFPRGLAVLAAMNGPAFAEDLFLSLADEDAVMALENLICSNEPQAPFRSAPYDSREAEKRRTAAAKLTGEFLKRKPELLDWLLSSEEPSEISRQCIVEACMMHSPSYALRLGELAPLTLDAKSALLLNDEQALSLMGTIVQGNEAWFREERERKGVGREEKLSLYRELLDGTDQELSLVQKAEEAIYQAERPTKEVLSRGFLTGIATSKPHWAVEIMDRLLSEQPQLASRLAYAREPLCAPLEWLASPLPLQRARAAEDTQLFRRFLETHPEFKIQINEDSARITLNEENWDMPELAAFELEPSFVMSAQEVQTELIGAFFKHLLRHPERIESPDHIQKILQFPNPEALIPLMNSIMMQRGIWRARIMEILKHE